jgi:thioredoxin 1
LYILPHLLKPRHIRLGSPPTHPSRFRHEQIQIFFIIVEVRFVSGVVTHVTDDNFEREVLQSQVPVLVDYWAEWCGPCKMIAPLLDEISGEYAGRLKIAKLNIDENPQTPPKYGIRGIPTLMLFKGGNVEATKVGALSKSQLVAFLDSQV